jgi:hypothetical protein
LTGYSVTIAGATINGAAIAEAHTADEVIESAGGNYVEPVQGQVLSPALGGTDYGVGVSGTLTYATEDVVLSPAWGGPASYGVGGIGLTGKATLTSANNVLFGSGQFGKDKALLTPNYYPPSSQAGVTTDTTYGVGNATSGTLNLSLYTLTASIVWPAEANVTDDETAWGPTGTEYAGTFVVPDVADVIDGVFYGAGGTEFEGESAGTGVSVAALEAILDARGITTANIALTQQPLSSAQTETAAAAAITAASLATAASVSTVQDSIDTLDWSARAILSGTVNTLNSKSDFTLTGDFSATDSMYVRCWLVFITGPNKGTGRLIGTYTGATKRVQFTGGGSRGEFVSTVSAGDEFYIVPTTDLVAGIIGVKNV